MCGNIKQWKMHISREMETWGYESKTGRLLYSFKLHRNHSAKQKLSIHGYIIKKKVGHYNYKALLGNND